MSTMWKSFRDGFVGSFVLAGAIVMAIISVASAFVNDGLGSARHHKDKSAHI